MNLANEGLEARKKEEEVQAKKRKVEEDKVWEGAYAFTQTTSFFFFKPLSLDTREQRVDSWRSFAGAKKKKKTKGPSLLG